MTGLAFVDGTRVMASRTEKCWADSVSLKTIGALGPPGLLSARGPQEASAAAPATPAAAPRNRRRSMRSSSAFTAPLLTARSRQGPRESGAGGQQHTRPDPSAVTSPHLLPNTPK